MTKNDKGLDELYSNWREGECQDCDVWGPVNDLGLCEDCDAKLDRDLIRQRAWEYSAAAFGVPVEKREELRRQVIRQFGEKLELIALEGETPSKAAHRSQGKRRKR